jgi:hypothetical protein
VWVLVSDRVTRLPPRPQSDRRGDGPDLVPDRQWLGNGLGGCPGLCRDAERCQLPWVQRLATAERQGTPEHLDYSRAPGATDSANEGPAIDSLFQATGITNEAGEADYPYYWTSTSALFQADNPYYFAWYVAFGRAVNGEGVDFHGAGAVRFDTKVEGGPAGEGGERYFNYVRLVRGGDATSTP